MINQEMMIPVRARQNTPVTNLFIKIVSKDQQSLTSKPFTFILPGGPGCNHTDYQDYATLTDVTNVIFFDPRGCGRSDIGPYQTYNVDTTVEDLSYVQNYLGIQKAIFLGKSFGTIYAMVYAMRHPEQISSLILAASMYKDEDPLIGHQYVLEHGTNAQIDIEKLSFNQSNGDVMQGLLDDTEILYSWKKSRGLPVNHRVPYPYIPGSRVVGECVNNAFTNTDYSNELSKIHCNTLILVGKEDMITPHEDSEFLAKHIKRNTLVIFPNSGHTMETDVPVDFYNAIRYFIAQENGLRRSPRFFDRYQPAVSENVEPMQIDRLAP